jgi:hypothetical protein
VVDEATIAALSVKLEGLKDDVDRLAGHVRAYHGAFLYAINGDNGQKGILVRLDRLETVAAASVQAETLVRVTALEQAQKGSSIVRDLILTGVTSIVTAVLVTLVLRVI